MCPTLYRMPDNSEKQKAEAADATAAADPNLGKVVKAFLVGYCPQTGIYPIFAEAATKDPLRLPSMDDSRDGLRFVGRDGQERAHYIPVMTICHPGAMTEIKKYLYGVNVTWGPQGVDKHQLTRDRDRKGPVEDALTNFVRSNGTRPSIRLAGQRDTGL
ncbi:hypothetical protein FHL15_000619 [Xylaria flabelliformis]|uniref:Uncharacterized protein n=1 Tax=Xylaria flabelliformis TaxID=2512241 RepID=A0A553IEB8_9PEZI|nr:hypothetical protein FHL15_000619 [Xylaria flabelliformis]